MAEAKRSNPSHGRKLLSSVISTVYPVHSMPLSGVDNRSHMSYAHIALELDKAISELEARRERVVRGSKVLTRALQQEVLNLSYQISSLKTTQKILEDIGNSNES